MLLGAEDGPDSGLDDAIDQIFAVEKDLAEVLFCLACINAIFRSM